MTLDAHVSSLAEVDCVVIERNALDRLIGATKHLTAEAREYLRGDTDRASFLRRINKADDAVEAVEAQS